MATTADVTEGTFGGTALVEVPTSGGAYSGLFYASLEEFKTWIELPAEDTGLTDDHLTAVLAAATRWIDQQCGRHFLFENEVTKLYYASDPNYLDVVDLIAISSIKLDTSGDRTYATTLEASEYELWPAMDETGRPSTRYQQIRIWPNSSHAFTPGELVQIIGDFGYSVDGLPPPDIHIACLILASRWWKRHETPTGMAIVPDMGSFDRVSNEDPDIKALLESYNRSSASSWVLV